MDKRDLDDLTGLPKRRYFCQLADVSKENIVERGGMPVVIAFNFVDMKGFNSKYGTDEGDRLLIGFSDLLVEYFDLENASRFGEDHFYALSSVDEIDEKINRIIESIKYLNGGKNLPVRIGIARFEKDTEIDVVCNLAKAAADTIRNIRETFFVWYDESISEKLSKREYILNHIDKAISEGWIEPFYQPVVRTYTKRLCGVEALARWKDPERGMIFPNDFVTVLEEHGLSYKLDIYMIERIVSMLQQRLKGGLPVVPVSVNISRSDFLYCDPVNVISETCDKHGVPRNLICVEITETALVSDKGCINNAITRFHEAGFDVWMDDFGSGYSSLNMLKDFDFDEIKLDMIFLRDFNERSKKIVTMVVRMAKSLGIHTLAEGVENEEHVQFLHSIGCERIQGYYYGKPMPICDILEHLREKGIAFETRENFALYEKTGLTDLVSSKPRALFFFDGRRFELIFRNEEYAKVLPETGKDPDATIDYNMNSDESPGSRQFRTLAQKVIKSGHKEIMTFVTNNKYFHFSLSPIARSQKGYMMEATLDRSFYDEQEQFSERDNLMRNMFSIYESVYILDFKSDMRKTIISSIPGENEGDVVHGIVDFYRNYTTREIFEDDLDRWKKFINKDYLFYKARSSGRSSFSDIFCIRQHDGNYVWMEFLVVAFSDNENESLLICIKPSAIESHEDKTDIVNRIVRYNYLSLDDFFKTSQDILYSFIDYGNIKFFWKDKEQRFLGASKAFCDYYGFESPDEFVGKTEEELGWQKNDALFAEKKLLETGESIPCVQNVNVIDGVIHNIVVSKFPLYHDNLIVGLIGYLMDAEQDMIKDMNGQDIRLVDQLTGLTNAQGLMLAVIEYGNNYQLNGENYIYCVMVVEGYEAVRKDYGPEIARELIRTVSVRIREAFSEADMVARTDGCSFVICSRKLSSEEFSQSLEECVDEIRNIREINGASCDLSAFYGTSSSMETGNVKKTLELAKSRLMYRVMHKEESVMAISGEVLPDQYSDLPLPIVVVRPRMDSENKNVEDMIFVFVNNVYCDMTGRKRHELVGKGYLETFPRTDKRWIELTYRASRGEYIRSQLYDGATSHWLKFTAAPMGMIGACTVICDALDDERITEDTDLVNMTIDEAVYLVSKALEGSGHYDTVIGNALSIIGEYTGSSKISILKRTGKILVKAYTWCRDGAEVEEKRSQLLNYVRNAAVLDSIIVSEESENIRSIELLREDYPKLYEFLKGKGVEREFMVPICIGRERTGYLVADNYRINAMLNLHKFLQLSSCLIGTRMQIWELSENEKFLIEESESTLVKNRTGDVCIELVNILEKYDDDSDAINETLAKLGEVFKAKRAFILAVDGEKSSCIYEWCDVDVESVRTRWESVNRDGYLGVFNNKLKLGKTLVIDNIEKYRTQNPERYRIMKGIGIERLMEAPFYDDGKLAGFICIEDYELNMSIDSTRVLGTAAQFLGLRIIMQKMRIQKRKNLIRTDNDNVSTGIDSEYEMNWQDVYKDIPIPGAYVRVICSADGNRSEDFEFTFANKAFCDFVKRERNEIIGKRYKDVFHNPDPQWIADAYKAAILGRRVRYRRLSIASGHWVDSLIAPAERTGYCWIMLLNIDDQHNKSLEQKELISLYETVIRTANIISEEKTFLDAANMSLREIGRYMKADRAFGMVIHGNEVMRDYEWCDAGVERVNKSLWSLAVSGINALNISREGSFFDDIEEIRKADEEMAELLLRSGFTNLFIIPVYCENEPVGYTCVQNFNSGKIKMYGRMIREVSRFIAARVYLIRKLL